MRKIIDQHRDAIFGCLAILAIAIWIYLRDRKTTEKGIFAIAKVISCRQEADGASLFVDVLLTTKFILK